MSDFKFLPESTIDRNGIIQNWEVQYRHDCKARIVNSIMSLLMIVIMIGLMVIPTSSIIINDDFHVPLIIIHVSLTLVSLWKLRKSNIDFLFSRAIVNINRKEQNEYCRILSHGAISVATVN